MKKINPIIENLSQNRKMTMIVEWLVRDLGPNIVLDIESDGVTTVIASGNKMSPIHYNYFLNKLKEVFKEVLEPSLSNYFDKNKSGDKRFDSVKITASILDKIINDDKNKYRDLKDALKEYLTTLVALPDAYAEDWADNIEKAYKKKFGFGG